VALVALGVFALGVLVFRIVSLGSILGCLTAIVLAAGPMRSVAPSFPVVVAICALILARHASNIARLVKGQEPRLGTGARRHEGA
jgi:glycerol-3-phosphate acyltransferase PlsY